MKCIKMWHFFRVYTFLLKSKITFENFNLWPLNMYMNNPKLGVSNQEEEPISLQRIKLKSREIYTPYLWDLCSFWYQVVGWNHSQIFCHPSSRSADSDTSVCLPSLDCNSLSTAPCNPASRSWNGNPFKPNGLAYPIHLDKQNFLR